MEIDQIIRSRRKSIEIIVRRDGVLIVRAPLQISDYQIKELVEKKADWIRKKKEMAGNVYPPLVARQFVNGENFWYLGKMFPLEIRDDGKKALELKEQFYLKRVYTPQANTVFTRWYREQAYLVMANRSSWYSQKTGLLFSDIKITSARTRWGSCNQKGRLCFSWRLVMAPLKVVDYVVVHELVHTKHHHHRDVFWHAVNNILPDYKQRREWLKTNGHLLTIE